MEQELDGSGNMRNVIPRILHRVWLGPKSLTREDIRCGGSWLDHHPGWRWELWNDERMLELRNQAEFDAATNYAQKADIARYEIVLQRGGIYIDTDFEALRPLDPLLDAAGDAFVVREDDTNFANSIFGAMPGHPLFEAVVDAIPESVRRNDGRPPNSVTGPLFLTGLLRDNPGLLDGVTVFGPELFFPYAWDEPHRRGEAFPNAYAVHHWAGRWREPPARRSLLKRAAQAIRGGG